jgi:hypothetical protein
MNAARAADLFTTPADGADGRDVFGLLAVAVAGLAQLERCPPLWGDRLEWVELIAALRAFDLRWRADAEAAAWSPLELWGLDSVAPRNRLSRMGGAWLASLHNHRVVQVDPEAIRLVTRTSARLSIYRPEDGGVLAWELRAPGFRHGISANVATSVAESLTLSR